MAAGVGEATAILAVVQLGFNLSKTLYTYIEGVKSAPSDIQSITNDIQTTSERLQEVGQLLERNHQTRFLHERGVDSAARCSTECWQIIEEIKTTLCKGGWHKNPDGFGKDEIDTSQFSSYRWPFVKSKLEGPQAKLNKIKVDIGLLYSSAMVQKASNA